MQYVYCFIPIAWTAVAIGIGYWFGRHDIRIRIRRRGYRDVEE